MGFLLRIDDDVPVGHGFADASDTCRRWHAIRRPKMVYRGRQYISSAAPLFVHQFSHAWFDFRGGHDDYANYFENSVMASLASREFSDELEPSLPLLLEGRWGISASASSMGYGCMRNPEDGKIYGIRRLFADGFEAPMMA